LLKPSHISSNSPLIVLHVPFSREACCETNVFLLVKDLVIIYQIIEFKPIHLFISGLTQSVIYFIWPSMYILSELIEKIRGS
jgi:hypothetical protein